MLLSPAYVAAALDRVGHRVAVQAIQSIRTSNLYFGTTGLASTDLGSGGANTVRVPKLRDEHVAAEKFKELLSRKSMAQAASGSRAPRRNAILLSQGVGAHFNVAEKRKERLLDAVERVQDKADALDLSPAAKASLIAHGVNNSSVQLLKLYRKARGEPVSITDDELYKPGVRVINALHDENGQMMDFYYGDKSQIFRRRNPAVAEVLHQLLGFTGRFNPNISGREAYLASVPSNPNEGWHKDCEFSYMIVDDEERERAFFGSINKKPQQYTVTQAMSWFFRHMVRVHGGAIYFEGSNIAYDAVFRSTPRGFSDSQLEAFRLFNYMSSTSPDSGSEFSMKKGSVIFTLGSQPATPTKAIFREYWTFAPGKLPRADSSAEGENHLWPKFH